MMLPFFVHVCVFFPSLDSGIVSDVALKDLLAYVSSNHFYLKDLPQRQPQRGNSIEFVELERLQPDILVHAVLRVVDITDRVIIQLQRTEAKESYVNSGTGPRSTLCACIMGSWSSLVPSTSKEKRLYLGI